MRDFITRLRLSLITRGTKAVALGVLFLFGCCCWVPMLLRASSPQQSTQTKPSGDTASNNVASSTNAPPNSIRLDGDRSSFWRSLAESLETDPLFSPADLSLSTRDPFTRDDDSIPVPIQTEADPLDETEAKLVAIERPAARGLELQSTMVGRTRRVAIINGRMYRAGQDVTVNGQRYRLAAVESQCVVLTIGDQEFVLTMPRSQLRNTLSQNDEARE